MTYDYISEIGSRVEREFPIGTAPAEIEIEGEMYKRAFCLPGIIFKGDGWTKGSYANADSVDRWKWDNQAEY